MFRSLLSVGTLAWSLLAVSGAPALAWNPPAAEENHVRLIINGQPSGPEQPTYVAKPYYDGPYNPKGHGYILQHAVRLLRNDGYENWADVAQAHLEPLLSGATHADYYKGRIEATLQFEALFGLITENLHTWDLTCFAGCDHYYDPQDGSGLDLEVESIAAKALDNAILKFALTIGSLVGLDVDISPENLPSSYPPAVDLCQQHFDRAVQTHRSGNLIYPGRSAEDSAYYELGWACHLLADMTVAQHHHNEFIGGHADYEDYGDHKGDPAKYADYHPASAKRFGAYHHGPNAWPARRFAVRLAEEVYGHPNNHSWAEDGGDKERGQSLAFVIPRAEAYTAGLLARFFDEVGIPPKVPPLTGVVRGEGGVPVSYAYLFYTPAGRTFQIEQPGGAGGLPIDPTKNWRGWSVLRADGQGRYKLPIVPDTHYLLRPAMPGHSYEGRTSRNLEFGQPENPATYSQRRGLTTGYTLDFHLRRLPQMQTAVLALPGQSTMALAKGRDPGSLVASLPRPIAADVRLRQSGTKISQALADNIHEALLQVTANHNVLGVQGGNSGLPEGAVVTVRLHRLMRLTTGQLCRSPADVSAAIDDARVRRQLGKASATPDVSIVTPQSFAAVTAALPKFEISAAGGKVYQVSTLGTLDDGLLGRDSLLGSGLVLAPDLGGAEIEVVMASGPGYLTTREAPYRLSTNAQGLATFGINAGSHAGRVRLQLRVVHSPDGVSVPRTAEIEFLVQPPPTGLDPAAETPPSLHMLVIAHAIGTPASRVRWHPQHRVTVEVGPNRATRPSEIRRPRGGRERIDE